MVFFCLSLFLLQNKVNSELANSSLIKWLKKDYSMSTEGHLIAGIKNYSTIFTDKNSLIICFNQIFAAFLAREKGTTICYQKNTITSLLHRFPVVGVSQNTFCLSPPLPLSRWHREGGVTFGKFRKIKLGRLILAPPFFYFGPIWLQEWAFPSTPKPTRRKGLLVSEILPSPEQLD